MKEGHALRGVELLADTGRAADAGAVATEVAGTET
jgi:hypothetical protein